VNHKKCDILFLTITSAKVYQESRIKNGLLSIAALILDYETEHAFTYLLFKESVAKCVTVWTSLL